MPRNSKSTNRRVGQSHR